MPTEHVIAIDPSKPQAEQPETGHNRWHEAIEPVVEVDPETRSSTRPVTPSTGSFIPRLRRRRWRRQISGRSIRSPARSSSRGAEPGDLLEAELLGVEADPWDQWGYTVQAPGFGFLRDEFPEPHIVHRAGRQDYARSDQLPGVRIPATPSSAPSGSPRAPTCAGARTQREAALADRGEHGPAPGRRGRDPVRRPHHKRGTPHHPAPGRPPGTRTSSRPLRA